MAAVPSLSYMEPQPPAKILNFANGRGANGICQHVNNSDGDITHVCGDYARRCVHPDTRQSIEGNEESRSGNQVKFSSFLLTLCADINLFAAVYLGVRM